MKANKLLRGILCSMFCLTTLVGCSGENPYEKAEAQTLDYNGTIISIEPDDDMTKGNAESAIKLIKSQPAYLLKNCTTLHWQGNEVFVQNAMEYGFGETEAKEINGFHSEGEIFLNGRDKYQSSISITDENKKSVMTHELWHVYDWKNGNGNQYISEMQILDLYNQSPNSISEYGATNIYEFFAEAGAMYINNPEELKERNIDLYNYFEALPKE